MALFEYRHFLVSYNRIDTIEALLPKEIVNLILSYCGGQSLIEWKQCMKRVNEEFTLRLSVIVASRGAARRLLPGRRPMIAWKVRNVGEKLQRGDKFLFLYWNQVPHPNLNPYKCIGFGRKRFTDIQGNIRNLMGFHIRNLAKKGLPIVDKLPSHY